MTTYLQSLASTKKSDSLPRRGVVVTPEAWRGRGPGALQGPLSAPITVKPSRIAKGGLSTDSYFFLIGG